MSHAVFAATLGALAIFSLFNADFAAVLQPVPKSMPARELLVYLTACILVVSGTGLLWRRTASYAAGVLLVFLLLWLLMFRVPVIFRAPMVEVSWEGCGETTVLVAAAWILHKDVQIGRVLYGLALIPLGLAHLVYLNETAALVPSWLPWHVGWAFFTGCTYIAAGIAVLIGVTPRLAAALAAAQMGLFTLVVWGPVVVAGSKDPFQLSESLISWTLAAAAWVVADSYRGMQWLATGRSRSS